MSCNPILVFIPSKFDLHVFQSAKNSYGGIEFIPQIMKQNRTTDAIS